MILLVMGVCGSGKTTVGKGLAEKLHWTFADADDFHPEANRLKMSQGVPLTDEDRQPWLSSIHNYMQRLVDGRKSGIVTCSALKRSYRNMLQFGAVTKAMNNKDNSVNDLQTSIERAKDSVEHLENVKGSSNIEEDATKNSNLNFGQKVSFIRSLEQEIFFVHLTGSKQILQKRMETRQGHFMPVSLLESQLDTLEPLGDDEPGIEVDIDKHIDDIVDSIIGKAGLV